MQTKHLQTEGIQTKGRAWVVIRLSYAAQGSGEVYGRTMAEDRHGPPPGLTEEERRRWWQWRKFTWLPGDIQIIRSGDGKKSGETREGQDDEQPERGE